MLNQNNNSETINEKMIRLNSLVSWFESDNFTVEKAIEKYRQAEALAKDIERELNEFKNEVKVLKQNFAD
jgi:exodeoxyribonuclease VII small subunit